MAIKRKADGDSGLNEYALNTNRSVEHLVQLQGREGSNIYRQMAKGDTQVGMILRAHKNPIRSACWGITTADDASDMEIKAIELIKKWFFDDYTITFDTLLGQILSCLEYGFSCFERVWQPYQFEQNMYLVPTLQQRMQTSIQDIFPDKGYLTQLTVSSGLQGIPLDDMVFFILNQQGLDMRGESLLRTAYPSWGHKSMYKQHLGIGIQRSMSGVPYMKVPKGVSVESKDYIAAKELLEKLVYHENAYMVFPEGYEFGVTTVTFNAEAVQKVIDAVDRDMALSVLAQFVLLGQSGKGGAYALSRDQSDFFLDGLQYVVSLVENIFHRQVITPMLKLNFGDTVDTDRIQLKGLNLNKKAGEELAKVLTGMTDKGYLHPTVNDEIQLRKSLAMPALSEEEVALRRKKASDLLKKPDPVPPKGNPSKEEEDKGKVKIENKALKFAEKSIAKRKEIQKRLIKEIQDYMHGNLLLIKDKLLADIDKTLRRGTTEIQGLKKIEINPVRYIKGLEMKLADIANRGWHSAKSKAKANKIKFAEGFNPANLPDKELRQYVLNESSSIVEDQVSSMKSRSILTASNGPIKGFSVNQTLSNVEKSLDTFIKSNSVSTGGSLVAVGSLNFGENQFNKEIEDQLWGYLFVAIDDATTTEICSHYNGKTYSVNGAELSMITPPLHPNCRSYLEPIYKAASKKPKIDDSIAPPSIQSQKSVY